MWFLSILYNLNLGARQANTALVFLAQPEKSIALGVGRWLLHTPVTHNFRDKFTNFKSKPMEDIILKSKLNPMEKNVF